MTTKLVCGHADPVLCVAAAADGKLLSGGESGQFCVWAHDGHLIQKQSVGQADITSICCSKLKPNVFYLAAGEKIMTYDIRNIAESTVTFEFNQEEINHIALNEKEEYLAAGDDCGHIKVVDVAERRLYKTLRKHTNICSSVAFRPQRTWDLISGALDSNLIQWDFSRGRSVCVINMQDIGTLESSNDSYLVNPPFIHSVAVAVDGAYIACGLENAQVQVFDGSKRTPAFLTTLVAHSSGVSQVHFPPSAPGILLSGSNDGKLAFWDTTGFRGNHHTNGFANGNGVPTGGASNVEPRAPPKFVIEHGDKVNWITSCSYLGHNKVVVADNTNVLTVYPFPE